MDTIKVFIASSGELFNERSALEKYLYEINNYYSKFDVFLQPILWELESKGFNKTRKQDDYNEKLLNSDIAIFIFGSRVGSYTNEEFDIAVKSQRKGMKPKHIFTYFRNIHLETGKLEENTLENLQGILEMKKRIETDLNQVHASFSDIKELKLQVSDEVKKVVTELIFSRNHFETTNKNNVLMLSRKKIHEDFSIDSRLHIQDGKYTEIRLIRLMNLSSNFITSPEIIDKTQRNDGISLSEAIEIIMKKENASLELMLTEPNEFNLKDIESKIANRTAGSASSQLYYSLEKIYEKLVTETIFKKMFLEKQFALYLMKYSIPYGIFNVEFSSKYKEYNHVKVDLYSAAINNENNRRSFIIWQKDDLENYNFFVSNFDSIITNESICKRIDNLTELKTK